MKLTKAQSKAHKAAVDLARCGRVLTFEEREQVWRDFHPGACNNITVSGAFFTPPEAAWECAVMHGGSGHIVDFCAGIGVLGGMLHQHESYSPRKPKFTCVELNREYYEIGKLVFPEADWILADAYDPETFQTIGKFDSGLSNPPFGRLPGRNGESHIEALRVLARITKNGAIVILPEKDPKEYTSQIKDTGMRMEKTSCSIAPYRFSATGTRCEMYDLSPEDNCTRKDVFESALTLLEWAVEQVGNGRDLGAFDNQTATFHGVVMPGLRKRR